MSQHPTLTSSAEDSPAKTSASPGSEPDSKAPAPASSTSSHDSPMNLFGQEDSSSSRTYPDSFPATVAEISPSFSRRWPSSGFTTSPGECWTADSSESPSDGGVCLFLLDVLVDRCAERFFLSPKACAGILRRAGRRGRALPAHLQAALERRASLHPSPRDQPSEPESASPDDGKKTTSTSSPHPSPPSGAREAEAQPETSARTSSPPTLFELDPTPPPSTTERSSARSSADSETPEPTSPTPKPDGSSPQRAAYTKKHAANHAEDYETWGEAEVARTLAGGELAHSSGAAGAAVVETSLPTSRRVMEEDGVAPTLQAQGSEARGGTEGPKALVGESVRKLTPTECERLQGFPDGWTVLEK